MVTRALLIAAVTLAACATKDECHRGHGAALGDSDCTGDRVCSDGRCVAPAALCHGPDDCALFSISPRMVNAGDIVELEGIFPANLTIRIAKTRNITPTRLSAHRATVVAPADFSQNDIALVFSDGQELADSQLFHPLSYTPRLVDPRMRPQPVTIARQPSRLTRARARACLVRAGHREFLVGGEDATGPTASVERALLNADGSLGRFSEHEARLSVARSGAACTTAGLTFYVIGGRGADGAPLASIEVAQTTELGKLGAFTTTPLALNTPRDGAAAIVIGNQLYVVGGRGPDGRPVDTIERAPIARDGTLGKLVLAGARLRRARADFAIAVGGGSDADGLYVIGGRGADGLLDDVERAPLADSKLLPFSTLDVRLTRARAGAATAHIGGSLYLLGGSSEREPEGDTTIERFVLARRETSIVDDVRLAPRRDGLAALFLNHIHFIGGSGAGAYRTDVESVALDGGAALGPFEIPPTTPEPYPPFLSRHNVAFAAIGRFLYFIGGAGFNNGANPVASAEVTRVGIKIDGLTSLLPSDSRKDPHDNSKPVGTMLITARTGASLAVLGSSLYVIGGANQNNTLTSVERGAIDADGDVAQFGATPGTFELDTVSLTKARHGHLNVLVGDWLYVVGGANESDGVLKDVERAHIASDGTLEPPFAPVPWTLNAGRIGASAVLTRDALFVYGGFNGSTHVSSIERIPIQADGDLGSPVLLASRLTAPGMGSIPTVVGDHVVLVGGYDSSGGPHREIDTSGSLAAGEASFTAFSTYATAKLLNPRNGPVAMVVGNWLFTFGGRGNNSDVDAVERAPLVTPAR